MERIFQILLEIWTDLLPFEVVEEYNGGARMRFGKKVRPLRAGFHWKIPFVNSTQLIMIKPKTIKLSEQSIKTKDGTSIVVKAVVKYEVEDIEKAALEVNDPVDAIADMTQGIIRRMIIQLNWDQCNDLDLENEVAKKARVEAKKWGLKIIEITFTDLDAVPSFRLFNSTTKDETYD